VRTVLIEVNANHLPVMGRDADVQKQSGIEAMCYPSFPKTFYREVLASRKKGLPYVVAHFFGDEGRQASHDRSIRKVRLKTDDVVPFAEAD